MTKFLHQFSLLFVAALLLVGTTARAQAPTNDDCLNAIDINAVAAGGAYFNYCSLPSEFTSVNATAGVYTAVPAFVQPACFGGSNGRDVWFKFTTDNTNLDVTLSIVGGPLGSGLLHQPQVALYREGTFGCPADGSDLDLECARAAAGGGTLVKDFLGLDALTTYYIRVNDYSASATPNSGLFQLCLKTFVPRTILDGNNLPVVSACTGVLVDDGNYGNYSNSTNETITLTAPGAGCMLFTLDTLNILGNATFNVYNGTTTTGTPLAALLAANNSNNPRQYIATSGSVTIRFIANAAGAAGTGFVGHWSCAADCATLQPCSATIYDPQGPTGNYLPNLSNTVTYCPNAPGRRMQINFHNIDLPGADNFVVHDGNSAAAPSFGVVNTALFGNPFSDYTAIASITNLTGCLTIVFTSDGSTEGTGYDATLQCNKPCQVIDPVFNLMATSPSYPSAVGDSAVNICKGTTVSVSATANYPENNALYNQNDASSLYTFYWGDGSPATTVQGATTPHTASHTYNTAGIHFVTVKVADVDSLCGVTDTTFLRVRCVGRPRYRVTAPAPICLGETTSLTATQLFGTPGVIQVAVDTITSIPPVSAAGVLCIPDFAGGVPTPFSSTVMVSGLNNMTLGGAGGCNIRTVYMKFQHTFASDIKIELVGPANCGTILLKAQTPNGGGGAYYGIANDALSTCTEAGQGLYYAWLGPIAAAAAGPPTLPGVSYTYECPIGTPQTYTMGFFNTVSMNSAFAAGGGTQPMCNPYVGPTQTVVIPGFYNSFDPITNLNGCPVNGGWTIKITDLQQIDNGIIYEWGMLFEPCAYPNLETYIPQVAQAGFVCTPTITTPAGCSPTGSIINNVPTVSVTPTTVGLNPYTFSIRLADFPPCSFDTTVNVTVKQTPTATVMRDTALCQAGTVVLPPPPCAQPVYTTPNGPGFPIDDLNTLSTTFLTTQSNLNVTMPAGTCTYVVESVQVNGVFHEFPPDVDMWLQSPTGQRVMLMSDVGGTNAITRSYKFKMSTPAAPLPSLTAAATPAAPSPYVCAPTNIGAADLGVPAGITTDLNTFTGNFNGAWSLKVTDGFPGGDIGTVADWSITFATAPPTYTSLWSTPTPIGATTQYITVNTSGTYTVTITEANGCTASESAIVNFGNLPAPTPINCLASPSSINFNWTAVNASPAVTGYEVSLDGTTWTNIGNILTYTASGLGQGVSATLHVRAIGACTSTETTGTCITPTVACSVTGVATNATCGANNGSIILTPGATNVAPNIAAWTSVPNTTPATTLNPSGLGAGVYTVTVTDGNSCSSTASFTITDTAPFPAPTVSCGTPTQTSVTFNWTAVSGAASYEYSLDAGATWTPTTLLTFTNAGMAQGASATLQVRAVTVNTCPAAIGTQTCTASACSVTATPTNATCGANNGSIVLTPSGPAPYTTAWTAVPNTTPATGLSPTGLGAGVYTVTVTDGNGCSASTTATITTTAPFPAPTVSCGTPTQTSVTFDWTAVSGAASYEYSLDAGATWTPTTLLTFTNGGMALSTSATIQVRAVAVNTCPAAIGTQTCTTNACAMSVMLTATATTCNLANGTLTAMPMGLSAPPITYAWSDASLSGASPANVIAGNYTVTITDNTGCTATAVTTVAASNPITLSFNSTTQPTCGLNTGTTTVVVAGGTPQTYLWSDATATAIATLANGNNGGTYTVTVTSTQSCTATASITFNSNFAVGAVITPTNVSCFGANDGIATTVVLAGNGGYTFNWSNGTTVNPATGLAPNTYTVTVTDSQGCTRSRSVTISEPSAALAVTVAPISNATCFGFSNGGATANPAGGTPSYSYVWDMGTGSNVVSGLNAGTHTVVVTDLNNCTASTTFTVAEPTQLTATASTTPALCATVMNGSVTAVGAGGTTVYAYAISGATNTTGATTGVFTGVGAGTYTVTVTDANLCSTTVSTTVNAPAPVTASVVATPISCFGGNNGTATVTAGGGNNAFTYLWDNGNTGATATALIAGTHTVTVTDGNACSITATINVVEPTVLVATITNPINPTCANAGANGAATANGTDGTAPYTYVWDNASTLQTPTDLLAGTHTVTITDANLCSKTATVTLNPPVLPIADIISVVQPSCGLNNGEMTAVVTNATVGVAYTYAWNGGITANPRTGLGAGSYGVIATDPTTQCKSLLSTIINLNTSSAPLVSIAAVQPTCANAASLCASTVGGSAPYTYTWSNGSGLTACIAPSTAGDYTVTVTDNAGCTHTNSATIAAFNVLDISTSTYTNVSCNAGTNGTITTNVTNTSGGTITYTWSNPAFIGANQTGLAAGTYTVTVIDVNTQCTQVLATNISEPAILSIATTPTVACNGVSNGTVTASITGGTAPYSALNWTGTGGYVGTGSPITAPAGTYTATVTDANLCSMTTSVTVTQVPVLALSTTVTNVCNAATNGTMTAVHAAGTYTYAWSNGAGYTSATNPATGAAAGTYTVIVTDANNCATSTTAVIAQPAALVLSTTSTNVCNAATNGTMTAVHAAGTYTYAWSNGATYTSATNPATGAAAGTYTVIVTDANNCATSATAVIAQPAALALSTTVTNVCNAATNGTMTVAHAAGTYTYAWSDGATYTSATNPATGAAAGTYTVIVTDANNCATSTTAVIAQPAVLALTTTVTNVCFGATNGTMTVAHPTGTGSYTYAWSNGAAYTSATNPATGAAAGTYTVIVTDANSCATSTTAVIAQPTAAFTTTTQPTAAICFGQSNGSILATPAGGMPPYTGAVYSWSGANSFVQIGNPLTGVPAGTYTVLITDASGCTTTATGIVQQPVLFTTSVSASLSTITVGGSTVLTATPVTGATYAWTVAGTTNTVTVNPLAETAYTVVVTNAAGCTATASTTVEVLQIALQMPNFFTPNGDTRNDTFFPVTQDPTIQFSEFTVYNRWGQVVHSGATPWDGNFDGSPQAMDTYVFVIRYTLNGESKNQTGDFMLIR